MLQNPPRITGIDVHHDLGVDLNYGVYRKGPQQKKSSGRPPFRERVAGRPPSRVDGHGPPGMGLPSGGASAGMSIHKAEGLVPVNAHGASNIPGLYAAGDALGSHMAIK